MLLNSTGQRKLKQNSLSTFKSPIIVPSSQQVSPVASGLNSLKNLHSPKGSQIDVTSLTRLIKSTKINESVNNQQIQALLAKAREIAKVTTESKSQVQKKHVKLQSQQFVNFKDLLHNSTSTKIQQEMLFCRNAFNFDFVIGIGGFGKVWKVEHKKTGQIFAMKEMSKALIVTKKSVHSVMNERTLLSQLKHPLLVNMNFAYQDRENLYLFMDYMKGGDLRYHIGRMRRFDENSTKFFIACIVQGLEYIHSNKIIHRDIKPENLVLDEKGYVHITDFGIARIMKVENSCDTSGTPGYMAPEVMCKQNHTYAVDYFAVGVIAYEFMIGRRPYVGRSRQEIRDQILAKQAQIKRNEIPDDWSIEAVDFINKLLQRKPQNRLGSNGIQEIKQHPWFANFEWDKLQNQTIIPPFIPNQTEDNFDQKQIIIEDEENNELIQQNILVLRDQTIQDQFQGYEFHQGNLSISTEQSSGSSTKHSRHLSERLHFFEKKKII
ncbi:unnamed protein product [Paramecium pentaurelia]|uniref:non-specific serine/threonine protein kinase n=1 Tax=Paramecium pentaurelia TaxID=43138 RepID=A0A8S1UL92_9CILI|nr:unnamed protein product [Paramecium pentaurelia]